jgi:hypothetical protein
MPPVGAGCTRYGGFDDFHSTADDCRRAGPMPSSIWRSCSLGSTATPQAGPRVRGLNAEVAKEIAPRRRPPNSNLVILDH